MSNRRWTSFGLLLVLACAMLGMLAVPATNCSDHCDIDCGACVYCSAPGTLTLHPPLRPGLALVALTESALPFSPPAPLPRLIEHVPLGNFG